MRLDSFAILVGTPKSVATAPLPESSFTPLYVQTVGLQALSTLPL